MDISGITIQEIFVLSSGLHSKEIMGDDTDALTFDSTHNGREESQEEEARQDQVDNQNAGNDDDDDEFNMFSNEQLAKVQSTGNDDDDDDDGVTYANDHGVGAMAHLLDNLDVNHQTDSSMVEYKGERVKRTTAEVLEHVVDDFGSHFGCPFAPNVKLCMSDLTRLAYDEKYKSKNEEPSDKFTTELQVVYNDVNTARHGLIALDNCYVDLCTHSKKDGSPVSNYGTTWVNVYLGNDQIKQFIGKFKEDTNWSVSQNGLTVDKSQGLTSFTAGMDTESPPGFYVMQKVVDERGAATGDIAISSRGTIQETYQDPGLRAIYKCTMFCTVTVNVAMPVGTLVAPKPTGSSRARVKFHISSIRAYGAAEGITSVKLQSTRFKSSFFG